ncbi:MAG TPA: hypothetical protein VFA99_17780 [Acidobacteriaceae bacterium]|nr:hypothetical protein [Acidobacteriaceae bacterium]
MATTKILKKKEKGLNRHWKNYIDKNYLGSHNLEPGEEMLLTIARFEGEELVQKVDGKKDEKIAKQVLYFKEDVPKMILNVTNGTTIASLYGSHPESWIGKQIQVYATPVKAFGKTQDALRIRDFVPKIDVDVAGYTEKMAVAKTVDELKKIWATFPASARNDKDLIAAKDGIKEELSKTNATA